MDVDYFLGMKSQNGDVLTAVNLPITFMNGAIVSTGYRCNGIFVEGMELMIMLILVCMVKAVLETSQNVRML